MSHNLDDLIIEEPKSSEGQKPKKSVLSKIALIIIVLIVGVVISKLIISDSGDPIETVNDEELSGIVDPTKTDPEIAKLADGEGLDKQNGASSIDSDLIPIDQGGGRVDDISLDDSSFDSDYGSLQTNNTLQVPTTQTTSSAVQTPKSSFQAEDSEFVEKPTPQSQSKSQSKPQAQPKVTQRQHTKPKPTSSTKSRGRYFIQIGSFSRRPSDRYINKIKAKGYTPFIIKTETLYKVRVGPYGSFQEAKEILGSVKSALNTDGFIVKRR